MTHARLLRVKVEVVYQLIVVELRSFLVDDKPPCGSTDRGAADIAADGHVAEEQPAADEWFLWVAWRFVHDVQVWRIEAQCRGRQTVRH